MFILTWIPLQIWLAFSLVFALVYVATHFLHFIPIPVIKVYKVPLQIGSIVLFILNIFICGIVYNENSWQEKLKLEQEKYELAKQEQAKANEELDSTRKAKEEAIKDTSRQLREQNAKFIQVMKSKDATIENIINSFDQAAKAKYDALSAADRANYNSQLQSALTFEKNCPVVPELYINKLNNRAANPVKKDENK